MAVRKRSSLLAKFCLSCCAGLLVGCATDRPVNPGVMTERPFGRRTKEFLGWIASRPAWARDDFEKRGRFLSRDLASYRAVQAEDSAATATNLVRLIPDRWVDARDHWPSLSHTVTSWAELQHRNFLTFFERAWYDLKLAD